MSTVNTESILDRARNIFQQGHTKECLLLLQSSFKELELEEALKYRFRNEMALLLSNLNRMEVERFKVLSEDYNLQSNKLNTAVLDLISSIELYIISSQTSSQQSNGGKYRVELELNLDFENTTDDDIQKFLAKIATIIRTNPDELKIINKRPGSIILELELAPEVIVKIKSLIKTGKAKILRDIRGFGTAWDWMGNNPSFSIYLNRISMPGVPLFEADFSGANFSEANLNKADLSETILVGTDFTEADLREADLRETDFSKAILVGADLSGADLSWATLNWADLSGAILTIADCGKANFSGANLSRANLSGTNLSGANLSGANLSGANLSEANLSEANLSRANLSEANLSEANLSETNFTWANLSKAKLSQTVFHISQARVLREMRIDFSKVVFVDDDNKRVLDGLFVE